MKRSVHITSVLVVLVGVFLWGAPIEGRVTAEDLNLKVYKNELVTVYYPDDWACDSSKWGGLDAYHNSLDIYKPLGGFMWIHIDKVFYPYQFEDVDEAARMVKEIRAMNGDSLVYEAEDIYELGGYPTKISYYIDVVDADTIAQKQFTTYMKDSHIVLNITLYSYLQYFDIAEYAGDQLIGNIELRKVDNPLEDESLCRKVMDKAVKDSLISEKDVERMRLVGKKWSGKKSNRQ